MRPLTRPAYLLFWSLSRFGRVDVPFRRVVLLDLRRLLRSADVCISGPTVLLGMMMAVRQIPQMLFEVLVVHRHELSNRGSEANNLTKRDDEVRVLPSSGIGHRLLDGEVASLDSAGKPQFYELMWPAKGPTALSMSLAEWRDLRSTSLLDRKATGRGASGLLRLPSPECRPTRRHI